jgi:hypothetical protein
LIVAQTTMHAYAHATAPTARSRENCNVAGTSAPFRLQQGSRHQCQNYVLLCFRSTRRKQPHRICNTRNRAVQG